MKRPTSPASLAALAEIVAAVERRFGMAPGSAEVVFCPDVDEDGSGNADTPPRCDLCGGDAVCLGGDLMEPDELRCDSCCPHDLEAWWCEPLVDVAGDADGYGDD